MATTHMRIKGLKWKALCNNASPTANFTDNVDEVNCKNCKIQLNLERGVSVDTDKRRRGVQRRREK